MKKIIIVVFASIFSIVACKKQNDNSATRKPATVKVSETICDPSNPMNSDDGIGRMHNLGMDTTIGTGDTVEADVIATIDAWGFSHYGVHNPELETQVNKILADKDKNYKDIINATGYSTLAKNYMNTFISYLQSGDGYPDPEAITYCDYKNKIMSFENMIVADASLDTKEKDIILGSTSVARYSFYLIWQNKIAPVSGDTPQPVEACWKFWVAVAGDVSAYQSNGSVPASIGVSIAIYNNL